LGEAVLVVCAAACGDGRLSCAARGEEILVGNGRRFRVLDIVPFDEEDKSPFVGLFQLGGLVVHSSGVLLGIAGSSLEGVSSSVAGGGVVTVGSYTCPKSWLSSSARRAKPSASGVRLAGASTLGLEMPGPLARAASLARVRWATKTAP
jgi:hypothetical protein